MGSDELAAKVTAPSRLETPLSFPLWPTCPTKCPCSSLQSCWRALPGTQRPGYICKGRQGLEERRGGLSPSGLEQGPAAPEGACSLPSQGAGLRTKLSLSS